MSVQRIQNKKIINADINANDAKNGAAMRSWAAAFEDEVLLPGGVSLLPNDWLRCWLNCENSLFAESAFVTLTSWMKGDCVPLPMKEPKSKRE